MKSKQTLLLLFIFAFLVAGAVVLLILSYFAPLKPAPVRQAVSPTGSHLSPESVYGAKITMYPSSKTYPIELIKITAQNGEFKPSSARVTRGKRVVLQVKSLDETYGFSFPTYDIDLTLEPGNDYMVELVANKEGSFTFSCSRNCPKNKKMEGELVVTP